MTKVANIVELLVPWFWFCTKFWHSKFGQNFGRFLQTHLVTLLGDPCYWIIFSHYRRALLTWHVAWSKPVNVFFYIFIKCCFSLCLDMCRHVCICNGKRSILKPITRSPVRLHTYTYLYKYTHRYVDCLIYLFVCIKLCLVVKGLFPVYKQKDGNIFTVGTFIR
jgi:hypothetical protein